MSTSEEGLHPPDPPKIDRRLRLHPWQWIGVPVLILIPVLALLGVFGDTWETAIVRTADVAVEVQYPERNRYRMSTPLWIDVRNVTAGTMDTVTLAIDTTYLSRFAMVAAIPAFEYPYVIRITDLAPGEARRVHVELQGEQYGRHSGELWVTSGGADTARIQLETFVFP